MNTKTETAKTNAAPTFKVIKQVTMPLLKFVVGKTIYIKSTGAIYKGKEIKGTDTKPKMAAADLMNVTNLETGETMQIIVANVLKGVLEDNYADNSYVGKSFALTKLEKAAGRQYFPYTVNEVEMS